jgi:tetratricopeptide (TPR) repeat protein
MRVRSYVFLILFALQCTAADLQRGKQLYLEGKLTEAEGELRQVAGQDANNNAAHRYLGLALVEQGKTAEAAQHINRAMELEASNENKLALARLQVAQKEYDKAEQTLQNVAGEELEYVRGLIHLNRERFNEAAQDLEAFIKKIPQHAYAHYYAGLAYNQTKQKDRMLSHFQQFVQMRPDAPEARKVRAVLQTGR